MGLITIFELKLQEMKSKKKRSFCSRDCGATSYQELCFLPKQEKILVALTSGASPKLSLWDWEKGKLKAVVEVNGFQIIRGMFVAEENDSLLFCYGTPEEKQQPIRSFFV